jgi:NADH-quinone oxidoreductase subunit G
MSGTELLTCTIDGIQIEVPKNTLIIRAAEQAGIMIPRFCDHPLLKPVAACRQCLVDVASPAGPEGKLRAFPRPQPACAITVTPGMVVNTQLTSPTAKQAQDQVAELILINHPLDCPVCDKAGECPLQNQAMSTGRAVSRFRDNKNTFVKPLPLTPQILLDRERCVLCQRCTRFALQIPADPFIALQMRGANQQIGTYNPTVLGVAEVRDLDGEALDVAQGDELTVRGEAFAGYFAGNIIQICPVGALTSSAYRFRARPFDLVSTASVAEHDSNCSAIRIDYRRGTVLRRLAADNPELNQEWISDKDRFGFRWQVAPDRLTRPLMRRDGQLVEVPWEVAIAEAAQILGTAKTSAVLPGGRLTLEDAYAYQVFARQVLATDNVDFRARVASAEEAAFLAHYVAGAENAVSFDDLLRAPVVLLVGFEPEEEGGILYLRLREAGTKVYTAAPFASRGIRRLGGKVATTIPGQEAAFLEQLVAAEGAAEEFQGAVIVLGERLASSPGAYTAALKAAEVLGARLVWIPRRVGERAAVEVGLLPGLGLAGHAADGPAGLDVNQILRAGANGDIDAVLLGGLEVSDLPDPELAREAFSRTKVVALQVRRDAVASFADLILPVAPPQEKTGTFINWEGRYFPFPQVLTSAALPDYKVLAKIAEKLGQSVGFGQVAEVHRLFAKLGPRKQALPAPQVAVAAEAELEPGQAILSSWHQLVDDAAGLDGEPYVAASAPAPVVRLSAATASALGIDDGADLAVSTDRGQIVLPAKVIEDMSDNVVHLPTKSPGSWVLQTLGAAPGSVVNLSVASVANEPQTKEPQGNRPLAGQAEGNCPLAAASEAKHSETKEDQR